MDPWLLGGSLLGVLLTAALVALLGLGRDGTLADPARLAEDLLAGFESAAVYGDDRSALVQGCDGSWALLRLHGLHPVARRFPSLPRLDPVSGGVRIQSGEARFGDVILRDDKLLTLL